MFNLEGGKAVFFGAHTDDEMICAGTLHRLARTGCEVHVVTFAPAAIKEDRRGGLESSRVVIPEWIESLSIIGVHPEHRHYTDYTPSADLQRYRQDICQYAYNFCEREKPDLVLTLSPEDENTAHSIVGIETERVLRGRVPVVLRCQFPWNYSMGRSSVYIQLYAEDLEAKRRVIDTYKSQHFRYQYEQILMHQVLSDGPSVKAYAAEKFELVRGVL